MDGVIDGGAGVGDGFAIAGAGGAEVGRSGHVAGEFEEAAVEADQNFRPAANPADFAAQQYVGGVDIQAGDGGGADAIGAVVTAGGSADMEAAVAGESDILDGGAVVGA